MTAQADSTTSGQGGAATAARSRVRRAGIARWRPSAAVGAIVLGLVASQAAAGALIWAAGGDDAPRAVAALAAVVADLAAALL